MRQLIGVLALFYLLVRCHVIQINYYYLHKNAPRFFDWIALLALGEMFKSFLA